MTFPLTPYPEINPKKIKPYVEPPNLLPVHPDDYFEQLEPRVIVGSCLAFGGAESMLNQAMAAEPANAIHIPLPEFLNESLALRASRPTTEIPALYTFQVSPLRALENGDLEGGYFRNHERNKHNWLVPDAGGGASLTGKDAVSTLKELPEVGIGRGRSTAGAGSSSSSPSGGASTTPEVLGGGETPKEPEFIIEPIDPGNNGNNGGNGGNGTNPTDPTTPINPGTGTPVLGASGAATIPVGKEYTLNLSATGTGSDTIQYWTIDWGDGTVENLQGNPNKATHTYQKAGDYVIKTSATNPDKTYSGPSVPVRVTENRPPEFVSQPGTEAGVDRQWNYDAKAVDPDGDTLTYSLVSGPGGMTIDTNTGRLSWTPGAEYVGQHQVIIDARDPGGLSCRQEFTLTVAQDLQNRPPEITSTPGTTGYVGKEYTYQVEARDPDGDILSYTLMDAPSGMTIDSQTGLIAWTPTAEMADQSFAVKVLVEDGYGGSATQEYQITVLTPQNNGAPIFVTDPDTTHYTPDLSGTAVGEVSHERIDVHLDVDEILNQLASIKISEEVPMVDIFLTFDSTGSFSSFARSLAVEFPKIIKAITEAMPGVSFAFGIGMFHEYAKTGTGTDRPFTLNQPIIVTDTDGFLESIEAALNSWRSGGAGYQTIVEALYQIATGAGYDGNNDGDTDDSGPAGLRDTQMNPGTGGDVPSYDSFIPDPDNNVLPASGTVGGVGFRQGALPIIIAASDVPFIYQADGSTTITGVNDVEIPSSYFNGFPTYNTQGNGATIQEAVNALKDIGAIVIGMGTEGARKGMEALSILTGGVNGTGDAIDTGTGSTIEAGDPYFFPISINNASQTADGIIKAIQAAMVATRNDIEVVASKDGIPFANLTGVIKNVGAGDTITFDLSFLGDGYEHSFDIQFVKAGTGVILGSIPATISTTYRYDARAVDPDGDDVTYAIVGDANGATIDSISGCIVWNPAGNGLYSFTVRATDEFGNSSDQIFDIQVGDRPTKAAAPTINGIETNQAEVDRPFSSKVDATSPNGESMSYYLIGNVPSGVSIDKKTGEITWQPVGGQEGSHEITVRVVSSEGVVAERNFTLEVMAKQVYRNTKPVFTSDPVEIAVVDKEYRYKITTRDAEGDPVTLKLLMAPEGMILDSATGQLLWYPGEADIGTHSIIIQADDGNGGLGLQVFTLEVGDGNIAPVFTSQPPAPSYAGTSYLYVVKASDPNGDTVTFTLDDVSIANGITLDQETGLLAWSNIPAGEYHIIITASDGRGGVSTQPFVLQIPSNQPARIVSEPVTFALKDNPYAYQIITEDPNGDPITLSLDQASVDRGMFIDAGGVLRWQSGSIGDYKVTLTAVDPAGVGMVQQFTINVVESVPANNSPVITSQPETAAWENVAYKYTVIASDPDGDPLTYAISTDKTASGLTITTAGVINWTTPKVGEYQVTVTVTDKLGAQAIQVFKLAVNAMVNRPPYITSTPSTYNFNVGESFRYQLAFNDPDRSSYGDVLTVTLDDASLAKGIAVTSTATTTANIDWTSLPAGEHTITITVTDKGGLQAVQTFTVRVFDPSENIDKNLPPRITSNPTTHAEKGKEYQYTVVAVDPEGQALSYSLDADSLARGMIIIDGVISWTPSTTGEFQVSVTATDALGAKNIQSYVLTVTEPGPAQNQPARFLSDPERLGVVGQESRYTIDAEDPEGGEVTITLVSGAAGMRLEGNELVWTPTTANIFWVYLKVVDEHGDGEVKKFRFASVASNYYYVNGYTGDPIAYTIDYTPPSGGAIVSITLDNTSIGRGMTIENGVLKWTPTTAVTNIYATLTVVDDQGKTSRTYVYFTILERNQPPVITSTPVTVATATESYRYQVEAYDPEGATLYYSIASSPNISVAIDQNGLVTLASVPTNRTTSLITVTVRDASSTSTACETQQIYTLTIVPPTYNRPPVITTVISKNLFEVGDSYSQYIYASDPDHYGTNYDYVTFSLNQEALDAGMTIQNYATGMYCFLRWSPTMVGSHKVILTATDSHGASTTQEFMFHAVERHNRPLNITSSAPTFGWINEEYRYSVTVTDGNSDAVILTLDQDSIARGMILTGKVLTWTPTALGDFAVTLTAVDEKGAVSKQTFVIHVGQREYAANQPARFTSEPLTIIAVGQEYRYNFSAEDPDGGSVTYTLDAKSLARGMYFDGNTLVWDNPPMTGSYTVAITVKDEEGAGETQCFRLHVMETTKYSRPPSISSTPSQIAVVGREYQYQVVASDPDGDELIYTLAKGPAGMSIDPFTGHIAFKPSKTGTYEVEITVSDGNHILTQSYGLAVIANIPPQISTTPGQMAYVGQEYAYQPQATDVNGDGFTWALESSIPGMTIDSQTGKITYTPTEGGVVDVVLVVKDEYGAESRQKWNILVRDPNANAAPVIHSQIRDTIQIGSQLLHQIIATDADGDALSYSLVSGPLGMIVTGSGLLSWTPSSSEMGIHSFTVRVTDERGASTEQTYSIAVVNQMVNKAPTVTNTPPQYAIVGEEWVYRCQATDPEGDTITYSLDSGPAGMTIDPISGTYSWRPTAAQLGDHEITFTVVDSFGAYSTYAWTVTVQMANTAPSIVSTPPTTGKVGQPWVYQVVARDGEGDSITYSLGQNVPPTMVIDPQTGRITFTSDVVGQFEVEVFAKDSRGAVSSQKFTLAIKQDSVNLPPNIESVPVCYAVPDKDYEYQVVAHDPNGDALAYGLATAPAGMKIDQSGKVTWSPTAQQVGDHRVEITVFDGEVGIMQSFLLRVLANSAPQFSEIGDKTITAGKDFLLDAVARDADNDLLTYELVEAPEGMTIDSHGRITWQTDDTHAGTGSKTHTVVVRARDPFMEEALVSFTVTVNRDTVPPEVSVTPNKVPAAIYDPVSFWIQAFDDGGIASMELTIDGKHVAINNLGISVHVFDTAGIHTIVATAWDQAGNESRHEITLLVYDPSDRTPPVVKWNVPGNLVVEQPFELSASVHDPDSDNVTWTLTMQSKDTGVIRTLASGTGKIADAFLAGIDPSEMANGPYILTLHAIDGSGHESTLSQVITIKSNYKVGNFNLSFQDMQVNLGGIPIIIQRTYDTFDAGKSGDFGYGWTMSYIPVSLKDNIGVDLVKDPTSALYIDAAFYIGAKITVRMPDGKTEVFTVDYEAPPFALPGQNTWRVKFKAESGSGATLALAGGSPYFSLDEEGRFTAGGMPFNPASPYTPFNYVLTTEEGMQFNIDGKTGQCTRASEPGGNYLEVRDNGIRSYGNDGKLRGEVIFERDGKGRITAIKDTDGQIVTYEYNAKGDLVAVTSSNTGTVTVDYLDDVSAPDHYLKSITDKEGVTALEIGYDYTTGRITSITDAAGNSTGVSFVTKVGPGLTAESVTDVLGRTTEEVVDSNGNVVRTIKHIPDASDPTNRDKLRYQITVEQFDAKGNSLRKARPFEVSEAELRALGKNQYDYLPSDIVWEVQSKYNSKGLETESTNVYGQTTYYSYDSKGNLTTTVDPLGRITINKYDSSGRVTSVIDSTGKTTVYSYDNKGNVTSTTTILPNGETIASNEIKYSSSGQILNYTDNTGDLVENGYDKNNRHIFIKTTSKDINDKNIIHVTVKFFEYDDLGNVSCVWQEVDGKEVSRKSYEYDIHGNIIRTVENGLTTENTYDSINRLIETKREVINENGARLWAVTRTIYDALDQIIWIQEEHIINITDPKPIATRGNYISYNAYGEIISSELRDNVEIVIENHNGIHSSKLSKSGTLLSTAEKGYDETGRLSWTKDESGLVIYNYTNEGAISHTSVDLDGDLGTIDDRITTSKYTYDEYGRQSTELKDADGNLSTTDDQTTITYIYDSQSRLTKSIYSDGSFVSCEYDKNGNVVAKTDRLGSTIHYEYDSFGNTTAIVLPAIPHPETGEMVRPRYEYSYNSQGNLITFSDNIYVVNHNNKDSIVYSDSRSTSYTYDWRGNQTSRTLPDGSTEHFVYDEFSRQIRHISFEGRVTFIQYDALGRVSGQYYYSSASSWNNGNGSPTRSITYVYDEWNRVIIENDSDIGAKRTEYNNNHQVTKISAPNGTINYEYNKLGFVTRTWTGDNESTPITDIRNTYDSQGRLETVTTYAREGAILKTPEMAKYVYDIIGNLDKIVHDNGIVSDYNYDALNQLKELTHYAPDTTPEDLSDNEILQRYSYNYNQDGSKAQETFIDVDGAIHTWDWVYDQLGRLIRETHENNDDALDYDSFYKYDLVGNRIEKSTDNDLDGIVDEIITSKFDVNDRLLNELKVFNGQQIEKTDYSYQKTEQIARVVVNLLTSKVESKTSMTYNEQGRMSKVIIETFTNGIKSKELTQQYYYESNGIKVRQVELADVNADGKQDSSRDTTYVNDHQNHTGYSQVLEEKCVENGKDVKVTTYSIGHQTLTQFSTAAGLLTLLADGHGSTRAVTDVSGKVTQQYSYDAYGNAHGFDTSEAQTKLLYSGEQFNSVTGLQYLRARWYSPESGRFNRLDPFAGDLVSPLSFHKYAYGHMNPVNNIDPTGLFSIVNMAISMAISNVLSSISSFALETVIGSMFTSFMDAFNIDLDFIDLVPDTLALGFGLSANVGIGKFPVRVAGSAGVEFHYAPKVDEVVIFGTAGWGGTFGGGKGKKYRNIYGPVSGNIESTLNVGAFYASSSSDVAGRAWAITAPIRQIAKLDVHIAKKGSQLIRKAINNSIEHFAKFKMLYNLEDPFKVSALSQVLADSRIGAATIVWGSDPGSAKGMMFSFDDDPFGIMRTYAWQLAPKYDISFRYTSKHYLGGY